MNYKINIVFYVVDVIDHLFEVNIKNQINIYIQIYIYKHNNNNNNYKLLYYNKNLS